MRRAFWFPVLSVLLALSVLMVAGVHAGPPLPQMPPSPRRLTTIRCCREVCGMVP